MADATAKNKNGDKLSLYIQIDEDNEDNNIYTVTWEGICGYDSVSLDCTSEEDARKLFEALQLVSAVDAD